MSMTGVDYQLTCICSHFRLSVCWKSNLILNSMFLQKYHGRADIDVHLTFVKNYILSKIF